MSEDMIREQVSILRTTSSIITVNFSILSLSTVPCVDWLGSA